MKTINQILIENIAINIDGVEFSFTNHFFDRLKERIELKPKIIEKFLYKIKNKLVDLNTSGEFLFYSKKLKQGIVATWNKSKHLLSLITFLPKNKHHTKDGTEEIVIENYKNYIIIYLD